MSVEEKRNKLLIWIMEASYLRNDIAPEFTLGPSNIDVNFTLWLREREAKVSNDPDEVYELAEAAWAIHDDPPEGVSTQVFNADDVGKIQCIWIDVPGVSIHCFVNNPDFNPAVETEDIIFSDLIK